MLGSTTSTRVPIICLMIGTALSHELLTIISSCGFVAASLRFSRRVAFTVPCVKNIMRMVGIVSPREASIALSSSHNASSKAASGSAGGI